MIRTISRRVVLALFIVVIGWPSLDARANPESWTIYVPCAQWDPCDGGLVSKVTSSLGGNIRDSTAYERSCGPYLLRSSNGPGKLLPLTGSAQWGGKPRQVAVSGSLGLFTLEVDSCWDDDRPSTIGKLCVPKLFLMDTLGVQRASFVGARSAAWSPDGKRLAFISLQVPRYSTGSATITYHEIPEGVCVFDPQNGDLRTFPATTDMLSWIDNETVMLEDQGRRYGLDMNSGHLGQGPAIRQSAERITMLGIASPDQAYIYKPGTLKYWSLWGPVGSDVASSSGPDSTEPGTEGFSKDLTGKLIQAIGGEPTSVSPQSFWVRGGDPEWIRGDPHAHLLCLGVTWGGPPKNPATQARCEVLVVDVYLGKVMRRFEGSLIGPAADATCVAVLKGGKVAFVSL